DHSLGGRMPFAHEPVDPAEIDRPIAVLLPDCAVAMPMAPQECIDVPGAEAVDRLGHRALERKPAHFAVGHDVEPCLLLERDGRIDGAILYGFKSRVTKAPGHQVVPSFAQRSRPQKTADNIGMSRDHRGLRRSDGTSRMPGRQRVARMSEATSGFCPTTIDRRPMRMRRDTARLCRRSLAACASRPNVPDVASLIRATCCRGRDCAGRWPHDSFRYSGFLAAARREGESGEKICVHPLGYSAGRPFGLNIDLQGAVANPIEVRFIYDSPALNVPLIVTMPIFEHAPRHAIHRWARGAAPDVWGVTVMESF